ncbi:MAG: RNA polymerase sigma factor [Chthoniobacterales bacterium]
MPNSAPTRSDSELVKDSILGDHNAFSTLFDRHYEKVRGFAYRILLDYQAADDAAQESFIRAARQIQKLRDGQSFEAWIFHVCSNVARDALRSNAAHIRKLAAAANEFDDASQPSSEKDELSLEAHRMLESLPLPQREAVVLVYLEDCSHAEAASKLGCAESTISWRIFLAKKPLRKFLKKP